MFKVNNKDTRTTSMTHFDGLIPIKSHDPLTTWYCDITWHVKTIILHYNSAYGHEIRYDGDIEGLLTKVTQRPDYVALESHVTNENHYISTNGMPMATRLDSTVTYFARLLTMKSVYALITWSYKLCYSSCLNTEYIVFAKLKN